MFRWPPIAGLLLPCRPSAIRWLVVAVIVGIAIQCLALWPGSHISVEISERLPSVAYLDASASVVFICLMTRVFASCAHAIPDVVFSRMAHAMSSRSFQAALISETAAASNFSRLHMGRSGDCCLTTVAHKFPHASPSSRFAAYSHEPTEPKARDVLGNPSAKSTRSTATGLVIPRPQSCTPDGYSRAAGTFTYPISAAMSASVGIDFQDFQATEVPISQINSLGLHIGILLQIDRIWRKQTPERCERMARVMRTGIWE